MFINCKNSKQQGNVGHCFAISYYTMSGYNISNPITDSNDYDFLIEKDQKIFKVQAKTTNYIAESGNYVVNLSTNGGNTREYHNKKLNTSSVDFVFVLTSNGLCYSIPVNKLTNNNSITLYDYYDQFIVMKVDKNVENFVIRQPKLTKIYYCPICENQVSKSNVKCKKCAAKESGLNHRKVERPDKNTLLQQLSVSNMTQVGKLYGVSNKAISKWLISYDLPGTMKELQKQNYI